MASKKQRTETKYAGVEGKGPSPVDMDTAMNTVVDGAVTQQTGKRFSWQHLRAFVAVGAAIEPIQILTSVITEASKTSLIIK
jgi:hypothetical protein